MVTISSSWKKILTDEFKKPYFENLITEVNLEYEKHICYPQKPLIFEALNACSFDNTKVIIIGQDPYHGKGEANGLCFSVNDGVKIPPSLVNIFKEICSNFNLPLIPTSGNLTSWATQGVLLLNSSLSVRENAPNSHKNLKWNVFTDAIIKTISEKKQNCVFLLWGSFAQKKITFINKNNHLILTSGHPSPMSANQGKWFGNSHFKLTNDYLIKNKKKPIHWF